MKTWQWLGYLGLIPFLICLWVFELSIESNAYNFPFDPQQTFIFYSAIILSFLAGTLWRKDRPKRYTAAQIISNFFCLYAFFCILIPLFYALILLPIGYLSLLVTEYILCNNKERTYTEPYFIMRLLLTTLVVLLHGFAVISWF